MKVSTFLKITLTFFCICLPVTVSAQEIPEYQKEFENLSKEDRVTLFKSLKEGTRLFKQQRIIETLDEIATAEKILPEFPEIMSLKGACYVEFRDFEEAEKIFSLALKRQPDNLSVQFNLGEIHFVQANWKTSKKYFQNVLGSIEGEMNNNLQLAEFKIYICDKKLGNSSEAAKIESKYDFTTDNPCFYYINAVKYFEADDEVTAQRELGSAKRVFTNPAVLNPWQDTMIESGYIKSFYGGGDRDLSGDLNPGN